MVTKSVVMTIRDAACLYGGVLTRAETEQPFITVERWQDVLPFTHGHNRTDSLSRKIRHSLEILYCLVQIT